jgi:hypothetical protein
MNAHTWAFSLAFKGRVSFGMAGFANLSNTILLPASHFQGEEL